MGNAAVRIVRNTQQPKWCCRRRRCHTWIFLKPKSTLLRYHGISNSPAARSTSSPCSRPTPGKTRSFYVNSPFYWGQPKRDGKKLVVIAVKAAQMDGTYANVFYQSRSTKLTDRPDNRFNAMIEEATETLGSFILEES